MFDRIDFSMDPFPYPDFLANGDVPNVFPDYTHVSQLEEQNAASPYAVEAEDVQKLSRRTKNFSELEDTTLVSAWLGIGMDATVGTNQKYSTFWGTVYDMFKDNCAIDNGRTKVSIEHRWSSIQENVSKFCGCFDQVQRLNQSGTTEQDKVFIFISPSTSTICICSVVGLI